MAEKLTVEERRELAKDIYTRLQLASRWRSDHKDVNVRWWASYYKHDVEFLLNELEEGEDG